MKRKNLDWTNGPPDIAGEHDTMKRPPDIAGEHTKPQPEGNGINAG